MGLTSVCLRVFLVLNLLNLAVTFSIQGIEIDPSVSEIFNQMKLRRTHKYVLFKILNKKKIVLDVAADPIITTTKEEDKKAFNQLKQGLTNEPRFILYDFGLTNTEGRHVNKIAYIFWFPKNADFWEKMLYISSEDSIKKKFSDLGIAFQAEDYASLDYSAMSSEVETKF